MWTNANVGQHHHGQVMNSTGGGGGGQDFYKPWPMYTPQFTGLQHNMALHSPRMTPNERPFENQIQVQPLQTISPSKNETSNNNAKKSKIRKPKEQTKKKKKPSGKWNFKNDISMLEFFKDHRCLWDSSDETFGNTGDAKKELVKLSKEMNIDAERIRRRFRKMRERFIVEAHKHSDAERNGKEYSVKWRYFTYLLFLLGKKSQDTGIVKAEIVIDDSNSQSISGRTEELTENLIDATSEIGVTDKNTDGNSEMAAVGIQEANNENKTDQVTNSNAELPPTTPSPAVPAPATPVVPAATTPVVPAPTTPVCPSPAQNGPDEGQRVTTTLSPAQPMFCTPQNIIHSGCISESFQLDSDLFGKQVAIHLNSLTPYYREISKLRIQEVMAHVALRSQGYPPVISFKQQSAADNLPNAG